MLKRLWRLPAVVENLSIPKLLLNSGARQHNTLRKELGRQIELVAENKKFAPLVQNGRCYTFSGGSVGTNDTILSKVMSASANRPAEKEGTYSITGRVAEIDCPFIRSSGQNPAFFASSLFSPPLSTVIHGVSKVPTFTETRRGIIKFSLRKGRRKTSPAVINRFYRLDWGAWISPLPGRSKKLWQKSAQKRSYLKHHVFRKGTEVKLLDKLVTKYWIKKKHFVNDPYETYHTRPDFRITKGVSGIASTNLYKIKPYTQRVCKNNRKPNWENI